MPELPYHLRYGARETKVGAEAVLYARASNEKDPRRRPPKLEAHHEKNEARDTVAVGLFVADGCES